MHRLNCWKHGALPGLLVFVLAACDPSQDRNEAAPQTPGALVELGRKEARACAGCHGPEGIARVPSYPSLAGLEREHLREQLEAFRSQVRKDPMMNSIARNLDDTEISALSHYYASLSGPDNADRERSRINFSPETDE